MAGWGNSWDLVTTVSKVLELKEGETTCLEVLLENKEHTCPRPRHKVCWRENSYNLGDKESPWGRN